MADESGESVREALKRVAVALKVADVPFAVAGGYASWARGGPEPEHDADVLVTPDAADAARRALAAAGLRVEQPPEDWLFKAFDGDAMVDVLHHLSGDRPVSPEMLARADELPVAAVRMPVLSATDVVVTKLRAMDEHYCDFTKVLPTVRALREQVDWPAVRAAADGNPFAEAFLVLAERLDLLPAA